MFLPFLLSRVLILSRVTVVNSLCIFGTGRVRITFSSEEREEVTHQVSEAMELISFNIFGVLPSLFLKYNPPYIKFILTYINIIVDEEYIFNSIYYSIHLELFCSSLRV